MLHVEGALCLAGQKRKVGVAGGRPRHKLLPILTAYLYRWQVR